MNKTGKLHVVPANSTLLLPAAGGGGEEKRTLGRSRVWPNKLLYQAQTAKVLQKLNEKETTVVRSVLGLLLLMVGVPSATAHPFHVSIAEADFNAKTGKLEVALRVHPADLERALEDRVGRAVDLDKTPDVDRLITAYLRAVLVIQREGAKPLKLHWVGKEVGIKFAWLFFEFACPDATRPNAKGHWTVTNRIFHAQMANQVNTITFKQQRGERSLSFTRSRAVRKLELPLAVKPTVLIRQPAR